MNKWLLAPLAAMALVGAHENKIGVVNFATCLAESKFGKQEQESFDKMKKQMESLITDIEGQLRGVTGQLNDPDYMDGLSPDGEHELKAKYQTLREEHERYQAQYYQVMQQANMQMVQKMQSFVTTASDIVAKDKHLDLIVTRDACFSFSTGNDVTPFIVDEMDKAFDDFQKEKKS